LGKMAGEMGALKGENDGLKGKLGKMAGELGGLKDKIGKLNGQLAGLGNENNGLKDQLAKFENDNSGLKAKVASLGNDLNGLKGQLATMGSENKDLKDKLSNKGRSIASLNNNLDKLNSVIAQCGNEKDGLLGKINDLENGIGTKAKALSQCEDKKDKVIATKDKFLNQLRDVANKIENEKKNLRANIAKNLARKFRENNIDAKVDPKTGNVTLLMDKNLLFETNSARLSKFAKDKLAQIIPVYSDVLFSDGEIKEKIQSFNVEGHASPNYLNGAVDPFNSEPNAYNYNLNLSSRRALSITNYIYGERLKFPHKLHMRNVTKSIGYGFTRPVPLSVKREKYVDDLIEPQGILLADRSPASADYIPFENPDLKCGEFSCSLSQRVELSFSLKDDPKTIEKILNLPKDDLWSN
ncbi:OmpA family protein, partial [Bacteriovorax sp. Seq25_V]